MAPETRSGFVELPSVRLYYKTMGSGNPLLFLHGGPASRHDYFLPWVAPLSRDFNLVFFDQRGSGKSGRASDDAYDVHVMVEDVEQLRKELGLGKINLLGHSYGGMLAQEYAFKYQSNLSSLILSSTFSSTSRLNARLEFMKESAPPKLRKVIVDCEKRGLFGKDGRYVPAYDKAAQEAYGPYSFHSMKPPPGLADALSTIAFDVYRRMWGSDGEFAVTGNLKEWEASSRLSRLNVPTLVLHGGYDMTSVDMGKDTAKAIKGAQLVVFERSGHFPFVEERQKYLRTVRDFLKSIG